MQKTASFWIPTSNKSIKCTLCPHKCLIPPQEKGKCGVRENQNGTLISLTYQKCSTIAVDPIEKKPLFHFHPATNVLSLGSIGCNLQCSHCQNYISPTVLGNEKLWETVAQHPGNQYDVIVPASGGRESTFVLSNEVKEWGNGCLLCILTMSLRWPR